MNRTTVEVWLETRRVVSAAPKRVFQAWTSPAELMKWWGPEGVQCTAAEINLRVGGQYRIANRLEDGTTLWIEGMYEQIEEPSLLVYSWRIGSEPATDGERVTVRFARHSEGPEVTVRHERIETAALRDDHERGWRACLDGLVRHLGAR